MDPIYTVQDPVPTYEYVPYPEVVSAEEVLLEPGLETFDPQADLQLIDEDIVDYVEAPIDYLPYAGYTEQVVQGVEDPEFLEDAEEDENFHYKEEWSDFPINASSGADGEDAGDDEDEAGFMDVDAAEWDDDTELEIIEEWEEDVYVPAIELELDGDLKEAWCELYPDACEAGISPSDLLELEGVGGLDPADQGVVVFGWAVPIKNLDPAGVLLALLLLLLLLLGLQSGWQNDKPRRDKNGDWVDPKTEKAYPVDPKTNQQVDSKGVPIDATTGKPEKAKIQTDRKTGKEVIIDTNTGKPFPVDEKTGQQVDPVSKKPIDPKTGRPTDKPYKDVKGDVVDPKTGEKYAKDPKTGQAIDEKTGKAIDLSTGKPTIKPYRDLDNVLIEPESGKPYKIDKSAGQTIHPVTGKPVDPVTGEPVRPLKKDSKGRYVDPKTGTPLETDSEGRPLDPKSGMLLNFATGKVAKPLKKDKDGNYVDPISGKVLPVDPITRRPIDLQSGLTIDTRTGALEPKTREERERDSAVKEKRKEEKEKERARSKEDGSEQKSSGKDDKGRDAAASGATRAKIRDDKTERDRNADKRKSPEDTLALSIDKQTDGDGENTRDDRKRGILPDHVADKDRAAREKAKADRHKSPRELEKEKETERKAQDRAKGILPDPVDPAAVRRAEREKEKQAKEAERAAGLRGPDRSIETAKRQQEKKDREKARTDQEKAKTDREKEKETERARQKADSDPKAADAKRRQDAAKRGVLPQSTPAPKSNGAIDGSTGPTGGGAGNGKQPDLSDPAVQRKKGVLPSEPKQVKPEDLDPAKLRRKGVLPPDQTPSKKVVDPDRPSEARPSAQDPSGSADPRRKKNDSTDPSKPSSRPTDPSQPSDRSRPSNQPGDASAADPRRDRERSDPSLRGRDAPVDPNLDINALEAQRAMRAKKKASDTSDATGSSAFTPKRFIVIVLLGVPLFILISGFAGANRSVGGISRMGLLNLPKISPRVSLGNSEPWVASMAPPPVLPLPIPGAGVGTSGAGIVGGGIGSTHIEVEGPGGPILPIPAVSSSAHVHVESDDGPIISLGLLFGGDIYGSALVALLIASLPLLLDYVRGWPLREPAPTWYLFTWIQWVVIAGLFVFSAAVFEDHYRRAGRGSLQIALMTGSGILLGCVLAGAGAVFVIGMMTPAAAWSSDAYMSGILQMVGLLVLLIVGLFVANADGRGCFGIGTL